MKNITTVFFDLGDTFRVIRKDADYEYAAKKRITDLLGAVTDPIEFYRDIIEPRYNLYREWALRFYCEAPEKQLWTRWLAYDYPRDRVEAAAGELTYAYRKTNTYGKADTYGRTDRSADTAAGRSYSGARNAPASRSSCRGPAGSVTGRFDSI